MKINDIKKMRDSIFSNKAELEEGRRIKMKKKVGLEAKKASLKSKKRYKQKSGEISRKKKLRRKSSDFDRTQAELNRLGSPKKGTRRVTSKSIRKRTAPVVEFTNWMEDVDEAVDLFIGMPTEVLPRVPWEQWHNEGMSAVVAAKNAVQMKEDYDEGDDEFETVEEDEDLPSMGMGWVDDDDHEPTKEVKSNSYHRWSKNVSEGLEEYGLSLEDLKKLSSKINVKEIHRWYNSGATEEQVIEMIVDSPVGKKAISMQEDREEPIRSKSEKLEEQQDGYVDILGVKMRVKPEGNFAFGKGSKGKIQETATSPVEKTVLPIFPTRQSPKPMSSTAMAMNEMNQEVTSEMVNACVQASVNTIAGDHGGGFKLKTLKEDDLLNLESGGIVESNDSNEVLDDNIEESSDTAGGGDETLENKETE